MREAGHLINRERSWLEFDRRVLSLAEGPARPLLERAKFLAIFSRNLDLRVEALVPVDDPALRGRLESILALLLDPEAQAWSLGADGTWKRGDGALDVQAALLERISGGGRTEHPRA
jgi:polyphosphate kinase